MVVEIVSIINFFTLENIGVKCSRRIICRGLFYDLSICLFVLEVSVQIN